MRKPKLIVEQKAEQLIAEVARLVRKIPYRCKATNDLERSADSGFLNLGEGIAAFKPRKKAAKYGISREEFAEVQRALRALVLKRKLSEVEIKLAYSFADEIIAMLTAMIKNIEARI
jgi:four helix bundle protein